MRRKLSADIEHTVPSPTSSNAALLTPDIRWDEPIHSEPQVTDRSTMMAVLLALVLMMIVCFGLLAA